MSLRTIFLHFLLFSVNTAFASDAFVTNPETFKAAPRMLQFEHNVGQYPNEVYYKANDPQATHYFLADEIRSVIRTESKTNSTEGEALHYAYTLKFVDAKGIRPDGAGRIPQAAGAGKHNYITESGSFSDVPLYAEVEYCDLWAGVDAVFYEAKGHMKYDFVVAPYADPQQIRFDIEGATDLKVNAAGELEFTTPLGILQKGIPYTYQYINGQAKEVEARYSIEGNTISFRLGSYDATQPLIIDPTALKWATFLGGSGEETPHDIVVDETTGLIYITGRTQSADFPVTTGATFDSSSDVFVTAISADGSTILWSTLIGGSSNETGYAIALGDTGDIFVSGYTTSSNFPTNGTVAAFDNTIEIVNQFLIRLDPTGTTLKYSTLYDQGTSQEHRKLVLNGDTAYFVAEEGRIIGINTSIGGVAGLINEINFPSNTADINITELEEGIDGNLWVVGYARSDPSYNFPITANAVQKTGDFDAGTGIGSHAVFIAQFSPTGTLNYSSWVVPFWGGFYTSGTHFVPSLDLDAAGNIYVAAAYAVGGADGTTVIRSPAIQQINELSPFSGLDYYGDLTFMAVTKIPANLNPVFEFVSLLPSSTPNNYSDPEIAIDGKGRIHIYVNAGNAYGNNYFFPYTAGAISTAGKLQSGSTGANYFVLNPEGNTVQYGTSVTDREFGYTFYGLYVTQKGTAYMQTTANSDAPVTPSYRDQETDTQVAVVQPTNAGDRDVHLAVFHDVLPAENTINDFQAGNDEFCINSLIFQNPNDGPISGNDASESYNSGDGSSSTHNLPDLLIGNTAKPHPSPTETQYLWQVSRDNGATWENGTNGNLAVYKPVPESVAGTVQYRRLIISGCDTLISNVAEASIASNFNLMVDAPEIAYYCEGTDRPIDITVTGASGNISWQWYNGFSPVTADEISPTNGTNVDQSAFTANIPATQNEEGQYRLIVTDANGCKKEVGVNVLKLSAPADALGNGANLCPGGTDSAVIGPAAENPDFDYSWTGPNGFTSAEANPEVTETGTYNLQVKLKTDAAFCAAGETSVAVASSTPFDSALGPIADTEFCQSEDPATIGLSGPAPQGYVFQWSPNINLDDATKFNPIFDPGSLPFGTTPIAEVEYTFTALRLSDGCIFETQAMVIDTALGFAFAGNDKIGDGCTTGMRNGIGGQESFGGNYQWTAVGTDFPGGLAALTSDSAYGLDVVGQQIGTNKFLKANFPLAAAAGGQYYIDFELKAAYVPFPTNCFTSDTMRLIIPPCNPGGVGCPEISSNQEGIDGACGGDMTTLSVNPVDEATYEWTTYSIDGVIQPVNTPPQGLFTATDDGMGNFSKGAQLAATGPHPTTLIVDFDDPTWGWSGANQVVYEMTQTYTFNGEEFTCFARQIVFSGQVATPIIGLIDKQLCTFPTPGMSIAGDGSPYTISGADYTQAPNASLTWSWTEVGGETTSILSGGNTPFPELNPTTSTDYAVSAQDPLTGCIGFDTISLLVSEIIADAGSDISGVCGGTIIQLGSSLMNNSDFNYEWSPTGGLNFPIGTPNSSVARPFLTVPSSGGPFTYTVTVTDPSTGCQASDQVVVTADGGAPSSMSNQTDSGCQGSFESAFFGSTELGATYDISVVSGGGDLSWFTTPTTGATSRIVRLVIPQGTAPGTYVFQVTKNKGDCGSTSATYTITVDSQTTANLSLAATPPSCTTPLTAINSDIAGRWFPRDGLYEDANGTSPIGFSNYSTVYVEASNEDRVFTLRPSGSCPVTAEITVPASFTEVADAGPDQSICPDDDPITLGVVNTATTNDWTAVGFNNDPNGIPATPTAGEASTILSYLSSASANTPTFSQSVRAPGVYVYQLAATFAGGCTDLAEVIITVPDFSTDLSGPNQQICEGASATLGVSDTPSGYNFEWRNTTTGALIGTNLNPTVSPMQTTVYQLTTTDLATGCTATEIVTVGVTPKPVIADVTSSPLCLPIASQDLRALIPDYGTYFNPRWFVNSVPGTPVANPDMVMPTATTEYFLVAENEFACPDTAMLTLMVEAAATPDIVPSAAIDCVTGTLNLADFQGSPSDPTFTLEWHSEDNTDPGTLLTDLTVGPGTYYLFEITPNDCESGSDNLVVVQDNCPLAAIGNLVFIDNNQNGSFDGGTDMGIDDVVVQLFNQGDNPTTATPVAQTTTSGGGFYLFDDLAPATYFVFIPGSEFGGGEPLESTESSGPEGMDDANDDNADENGQNTPVAGGVRSSDITLVSGTEPTGEAGAGSYTGTLPDANVNLTVDFGFISVCPEITNPTMAQTICERETVAVLQVSTTATSPDQINFVYFDNPQTGTAMYDNTGTGLGQVNPSGGVASISDVSFPSAGTFYVYAILSSLPTDAACRPFQEIVVTVNPSPDLTFMLTDTTVCNQTNASIFLSDSEPGFTYQLRNDADDSPFGSPVAGTGNAISFDIRNLSPTGNYNYNVFVSNAGTGCNGEMTDLAMIEVVGCDFQDYLASCDNPPCHFTSADLYLGSGVSSDTTTVGSPAADLDDDDGILIPNNIRPGVTIRFPTTIYNNTGQTAYLAAWVDWNGDGDFDDSEEQIPIESYDSATFNGTFQVPVAFTVPADAVQGQNIGARFRLSTDLTEIASPCGTTSCTADGEIEDYLIQVECPTNICLPVQLTVRSGN